MNEPLFTKKNERIQNFFKQSEEVRNALYHFRDNYRPLLNDERFLTDAEVAEKLRITRRTLQEYRNNGIVAYYIIGGKCLYAERDIENLLLSNYVRATS